MTRATLDAVLGANLIDVSKDQFFASIGRMDVHPHIAQRAWSDEWGYVSEWKTRNGTLIGRSCGNGVRPHLYRVTRAFYDAHVAQDSTTQAVRS